VTKNVIVYGNSEHLTLVKSLLHNRVNMTFNVKAFMEPDERSVGKYLSGVKVVSINALEWILANGNIDEFIIASKNVNPEVKRRLIDICMSNNVLVKEIPNLERLVDGTLNYNQLRNLNLEDLLSRDPIQMDSHQLKMQLKGRVIFVTGAAGSIGSEIVRQLVHFEPARIVLIDIAETPLYDIELELIETLGFENFDIEMASVRDYDCMEALFQKYRPDIVYHAAAYKHVPMVEKMPLEGVKTNIFGTKNIADLADKYGCSDFVMVSTDKAVNPTNVMGCTKRIAEIYTQSLDSVSKTSFITTRFGNVLGSNGSVILRFARQIEHGGPVTVTHPEITRFFMTIPEACQLVLQAGILGKGGEIFVFDMGECVKVDDLARRMITLSGYQVGRDIKIVYTGLRPGEKLYEEVLSDMETVLPTPHKRINRAKVREYDVQEVSHKLEDLRELLAGQDEIEVVQFMKLLVPEYKSNNSVFEAIDNDLEENLVKTEAGARAYLKRMPKAAL
jgi:FlaA1/EpsC-like NDP-sugar epimerase